MLRRQGYRVAQHAHAARVLDPEPQAGDAEQPPKKGASYKAKPGATTNLGYADVQAMGGGGDSAE